MCYTQDIIIIIIFLLSGKQQKRGNNQEVCKYSHKSYPMYLCICVQIRTKDIS